MFVVGRGRERDLWLLLVEVPLLLRGLLELRPLTLSTAVSRARDRERTLLPALSRGCDRGLDRERPPPLSSTMKFGTSDVLRPLLSLLRFELLVLLPPVPVLPVLVRRLSYEE